MEGTAMSELQMQTISLDDIKGAEYNPRFLSEEKFQKLRASIRELGIIKPLLVRIENKTTIAGHQRTKAMRAEGINTSPAYVLRNLNYADEVRFNQLHNACEVEVSPKAPKMRLTGVFEPGQYYRVKNRDIHIEALGDMNAMCNILAKLLIKYGDFACPLCTPDGRVHISAAYAWAAKVTGHDIDVLCLGEQKMARAVHYLSEQYGVFSYDMLEKKTYQQRYAQKKRLRDGRKGEANSNRSFLYEKYALDYIHGLPKTTRILDFGAGQKDYAFRLMREGYDVIAVEPYYQKPGTNDIDVAGNIGDFKRVAAAIERRGLFDIVVCDSVLNSVDSKEAEQAVIHSVIGLCRPGGMVFISGRSYEKEAKRIATKVVRVEDSLVKFYDKDNFSGIFRNGEWFYQKFHTAADIEAIAALISRKPAIYYNAQAFQIVACRDQQIDEERIIEGLRFEWNLPLPNGKRYGLSDTIEKSYRARRADD